MGVVLVACPKGAFLHYRGSLSYVTKILACEIFFPRSLHPAMADAKAWQAEDNTKNTFPFEVQTYSHRI